MNNQVPNLKYIAIEGPVGVGKSSLASKLAKDYNARLILEQVDDNPFLELFYSGAENIALPTQLYFLLSRVKQLEELSQEDLFSSISISDFVVQKDRLFASLTLDDTYLNLYNTIYDLIVKKYAKPDLVVYLQAPVEILIKRILKRGRHFEKSIEEEYLRRLSMAYNNFFYHYEETSMLIINTGEIDFVDNKSEYENLKKAILSTSSGRNYYNPLGKYSD